MRSRVPRTALLLMCVGTGLSSTCEAQNTPVVKVHAYEREVVGGIPGGPPGVGAPARQTRYFIYLETSPGAKFDVEGVWMDGRFHAVETAVKSTPVRFESPVVPEGKDAGKLIAVPKTANTVTEIVVKDQVPGKTPDAGTAKMLRRSQDAVQLTYQGKSVLVPVARFEKRGPLYMK
jgi:hypothetical protein